MGSQQWASAGAPPQQELEPPATTRSAACPYFSFTTSVMLSIGMMTYSLFFDGNDGFRLHGLVPGAAFGIEEAEEFLQRSGVGGASQKGACPCHRDEFLVLELVEMVREVGRRNPQFFQDLSDHHPVGMGGKQKLHDAQARFGSHGGEHVGVARDLFRILFHSSIPRLFHNSIII